MLQNPFDEVEPAEAAQRAARELMTNLPIPTEGKMFGVMVVKGGAVVKAFSAGVDADGWAPQAFDVAARARLERESAAVVKALEARQVSLAPRDAVKARLEAERAQLKAQHAERKRLRRERREQERRAAENVPTGNPLPPALSPKGERELLDDESRRDKAERRRFEERAEAELSAFKPLERRHAAIERLRKLVSREAMRRMHDAFVLRNALGEETTLRALFPGGEPPWGAGECAAVKLLAYAVKHRLEPIALAELWWGPPPLGGARVHGTFYPACKPKCGPVLPFLMRGLDVAPRQGFRGTAQSGLEVLHEDEHLAVVVKPAGLLSVPGKEVEDSVLATLTARHSEARSVHRIDLDTSGLMLVAFSAEAHKALQAQFLRREVTKRYVALLEGDVAADRGTLTLPMRVDLEQRPRQVVDFEHGKSAVTEYEVLSREGGRTRVAFFPRTGRTHQLRVHAAHAKGLAAPIVGDRLYGHAGERLLLHAEALTFVHPVTGKRITFEAKAPF